MTKLFNHKSLVLLIYEEITW